MKKGSIALAGFVIGLVPAFSQYVCVGSPEGCAAAQKKLCADEKARLNLTLQEDAVIHGTVRDPSGSVIREAYRVKVTNIKGELVAQTSLNSGTFNLPKLDRGSFRLTVVGVESRPTGFNQPEKMACSTSAVCDLNVVLPIASTDDPINFCPPE